MMRTLKPLLILTQLVDRLCGFDLCSGLLEDEAGKLGADVNQLVQNTAIALRGLNLALGLVQVGRIQGHEHKENI
jgi:hypothetical protein